MNSMLKFLVYQWFSRFNFLGVVATINVSILKGYTTPLANNAMVTADATIVSVGNAYTYPAGGFALSAKGLGLRGFDSGFGCISQGGNYQAEIQISKAATPAAGTKAQTAYLRLTVLSTGAEVAGGAALTADVVRFSAFGG